MNALPEFATTNDGVDIQFIHVRSREPNALPLILTHGWPGSPLDANHHPLDKGSVTFVLPDKTGVAEHVEEHQ